jgi:hypothetical protein
LNADGKTPHWGNTGHNAFDGPGLGNLDFSLFRKFAISEKVADDLPSTIICGNQDVGEYVWPIIRPDQIRGQFMTLLLQGVDSAGLAAMII